MDREGVMRFRYSLAKAVRRGARTVLLTPSPGPRLGNFLYYWLHAHIVQSSGSEYRVQTHDHLSPWLRRLPEVQERLCVGEDDVGFFDRREWPPETQFQGYGLNFSKTELEAFVDRFLRHVHLQPHGEVPLVLNVRRGDYYAEPKFRALYGFNVAAYVEAAMQRAISLQPVPVVRVVSDDIGWCRETLDRPLRGSGVREVHYGARIPGPWGDFAEIASASRLIGANSTFSYWGAYIATVRFGVSAHIQMPSFVSRHPVNARGVSPLLPEWDVVESIPGGWGPP